VRSDSAMPISPREAQPLTIITNEGQPERSPSQKRQADEILEAMDGAKAAITQQSHRHTRRSGLCCFLNQGRSLSRSRHEGDFLTWTSHVMCWVNVLVAGLYSTAVATDRVDAALAVFPGLHVMQIIWTICSEGVQSYFTKQDPNTKVSRRVILWICAFSATGVGFLYGDPDGELVGTNLSRFMVSSTVWILFWTSYLYRSMLHTFWLSVKASFMFLITMWVVMSLFAFAAVQLFEGKANHDDGSDLFPNYFTTMVRCFRLFIGEGWHGIMYAVADNSTGAAKYFFMLYTFLITMLFGQLLVGVIISMFQLVTGLKSKRVYNAVEEMSGHMSKAERDGLIEAFLDINWKLFELHDEIYYLTHFKPEQMEWLARHQPQASGHLRALKEAIEHNSIIPGLQGAFLDKVAEVSLAAMTKLLRTYPPGSSLELKKGLHAWKKDLAEVIEGGVMALRTEIMESLAPLDLADMWQSGWLDCIDLPTHVVALLNVLLNALRGCLHKVAQRLEPDDDDSVNGDSVDTEGLVQAAKTLAGAVGEAMMEERHHFQDKGLDNTELLFEAVCSLLKIDPLAKHLTTSLAELRAAVDKDLGELAVMDASSVPSWPPQPPPLPNNTIQGNAAVSDSPGIPVKEMDTPDDATASPRTQFL